VAVSCSCWGSIPAARTVLGDDGSPWGDVGTRGDGLWRSGGLIAERSDEQLARGGGLVCGARGRCQLRPSTENGPVSVPPTPAGRARCGPWLRGRPSWTVQSHSNRCSSATPAAFLGKPRA